MFNNVRKSNEPISGSRAANLWDFQPANRIARLHRVRLGCLRILLPKLRGFEHLLAAVRPANNTGRGSHARRCWCSARGMGGRSGWEGCTPPVSLRGSLGEERGAKGFAFSEKRRGISHSLSTTGNRRRFKLHRIVKLREGWKVVSAALRRN